MKNFYLDLQKLPERLRWEYNELESCASAMPTQYIPQSQIDEWRATFKYAKEICLVVIELKISEDTLQNVFNLCDNLRSLKKISWFFDVILNNMKDYKKLNLDNEKDLAILRGKIKNSIEELSEQYKNTFVS